MRREPLSIPLVFIKSMLACGAADQAQFWADSWEIGPTAARTPLFGNSNSVFDPPYPTHDQFLPDLPMASPELLHLSDNWQRGKRTAAQAGRCVSSPERTTG
jgi:hypothetical protein